MSETQYKNAQEFFLEGKRKAEEMLSEQVNTVKIVQECKKIINYLYENFEKLESSELSLKGGKLAILKAYLGEVASNAHCETNNFYIYKKYQEAWERKPATKHLESIGEKSTVRDVDAEVMKRTFEIERDWAFKQETSDSLKNLFVSMDWIITSIGWRIKEKNSEKMDTKYYDHATPHASII
jgi:hypothetical protein